MLSQKRYEGEAAMAAAARDQATNDEVRLLFDRAWAAHITAARHAMFAERWAQAAAGERQSAARDRTAGSGRVMTLLEQRAADSAAKVERHRAAAEASNEIGAQLVLEATQQAAASNPGHDNPAPANSRRGH